MSKPKRSRRPDGLKIPKTRQQQQQEVNVYIYRRIDALNIVLGQLAQKMEIVSKLTQQMIVTLVILNEKGLVTNVEIAEKQRELMLPIEERITGLADKVSSRAGGTEEGATETVEGNSEEAGDADTTRSNGDKSTGVSESDEVQSKSTGTVKSDVGLQEPRLSDNKSEGGNRPLDDPKDNGKSISSSGVSKPTDSGHKAPFISLD